VSNIVVSITGTGASSFAQTSACTATLAAGKSCTISVTFTPTATGARSGQLTLVDGGGTGTQKYGLTGSGK